jgi:NADPH-dependent 2,4-dienoyl-CoA reductase/sulfur reductase-like enzyme/ferredoxin
MVANPPIVEIREWGRPARRRTLSQPLMVGRDCPGEVLADDGVSRQHLRLVPSPTSLSAVDLGSRNGTTINGTALTGRAELEHGDVLRLGRTEIIVLHTPNAERNGQENDHDSTRLGMRAITPSPPPPPVAAKRSPLLVLAERILGIDPTGQQELFRAYNELPARVPLGVWRAVRVGSIAAYLTVIALLFLRPAIGLFVMFSVIVPSLPILFFIAPGLWRNICPMAASNQMPRVLGVGGTRAVPDWLRNRGYLIAVAGFFGIAGARLAGLDRNGTAMGVVLVAVVVTAVIGGLVFKGKSGWCSSICPLLPLQRVYGQTPFVTIPNSHCPSCVGCAKNCYDFKPRAAWQADMADPEKGWSGPRKLFVAALPGFVIGFFVLKSQANVAMTEQYAVLALAMLVSIGSFFAIDAMSPFSASMMTVGYGAVALNAFYWFVGPMIAGAVAKVTGVDVGWLRWVISVTVAALTLLWIARTRVSELQFALTTGARTEPVLLGMPKRQSTSPAASAVNVQFETDGKPVAADVGMSVLDIAEKGGQPIEAGCRMGVCGADPVAILNGTSCLSAPEGDELNTLKRLGLGKSTRMACCARIKSGSVTVSLTPEPGDGGGAKPTRYDRSIVSVVVLGNGIAGVTAADFIRRGHPDCEIHIVGRESHALYNRMGISRLVYGRSAMQGLYLLPEQWYDEHGVHMWLNTQATRIDIRWRRVQLGTGEALPFDRLILAMGSSAAVPPIGGLDRPGSFALREASDAMQIRAYAQQHNCRRAVVAGGGLLGLEAAYSLHLLGLDVTVLERGSRLLSKQIDPRCSELVEAHFEKAGIEILRQAETSHLVGESGVSGAVMKDARTVPCEIFLAATGIRPNIDLVRDAGIPVNKGVLVDDRMQTRVPGVFAAGDVAEHAGHVRGLWPVATEQAQAAAENALGGNTVLAAETPPTILKGVDLELFSVGPAEPEPSDEVIVVDRGPLSSYRRLVLSGGQVIGATVLGHHPSDLAAAQKAVRNRITVGPAERAELRAGNWSALAGQPV